MTPATKVKLEEKFGIKDMVWNWDDFSVTFRIDSGKVSFKNLAEIMEITKAKNMEVEARIGISKPPHLEVKLYDVNFVTA